MSVPGVSGIFLREAVIVRDRTNGLGRDLIDAPIQSGEIGKGQNVWQAMNPTIGALAREFKVCKVNADTNQELAARYGISSIPALLIFKDGKIAVRHVGVTPEATLRAEMQRLSQP